MRKKSAKLEKEANTFIAQEQKKKQKMTASKNKKQEKVYNLKKEISLSRQVRIQEIEDELSTIDELKALYKKEIARLEKSLDN